MSFFSQLKSTANRECGITKKSVKSVTIYKGKGQTRGWFGGETGRQASE